MRHIAIPAAPVGLVLLAACGGGGGSATPTPDFPVLAAAVVDDALLKQEDLPAGWETPAPEEDLTAGLEFTPGCDLLDLNTVFPSAAAVNRSGSFKGPDDQQVASYASVYRTTEAASDEMLAIMNLVNRCGDEYRAEIERIARARLTATGIDLGVFVDIEVSLEEAEADPLGDQSMVYRLQVKVGLPGADQSFTLDVMVVRVGRIVAAVTYAGFGEHNAAEERAVGEKLAEKMAPANERLAVAPDGTSGS